MYLRLKSEIFFILKENGIEIYYGNKQLNKLITTDNNNIFFKFLNFLKFPRNKKEIKNYKLEENIKKDIINYLLEKKYAVWEKNKSNLKTRTELFINTFPDINYNDYKNKIKKIKILLIGLGTAGSYILEILTKLGFNDFFLIDGDIVNLENIEAQFYNENDINKYKVDIIKNKYPNNRIEVKNKYIKNYNSLKKIIKENKFDYIINCADDYKLIINLLEDKKKNNINSKIIESGYSPLKQETILINTKEKANKILESIQKNLNQEIKSKGIVRNNGSIFNSWLSAFATSKMILDDILDFDFTEIGEFDFLQNRYFLGNYYNKKYFDYFSKQVQNHMKYSGNKEKEKNIITEDNIFEKNIYNSTINDENKYIKEYLKIKYNFNKLEEYEESSEKLYKKIRKNNINEKLLMKHFFNYLDNNYIIDNNDLNNILNNNIIEKTHKNSIKEQLIEKIENNYIIFNLSYKNNFEKIIGRIHELLHYIYANVTTNDYDHENFVMTNEIKFYFYLYEKTKTYDNLINYYFYTLIKKQIINVIVLDYEKSIFQNNFFEFKEKYKIMLEKNKNILLTILNNNINPDMKFDKLKYLKSFIQNELSIDFILKILLGNKR